jgi:ferric-dicitrate binding protein FerR (iron transport regulator)
MWDAPLDPESERRLAEWMQTLAAEPIALPPAATATEIWQKAELLRRWDAHRKAAAPIEMGERAQVGIGLVGALVLLVWVSRPLPAGTMSPTLVAALGATVLLLVSAAAFSIWALLSREQT